MIVETSMAEKKLISIITPCYNEEENIETCYHEIKTIMAQYPQYRYEHIFIDNASKDKSVEILKNLAQNDKNLKIIVNLKNFGQVRSPFYAQILAKGDAVIPMHCDLQEPPELIHKFLKKWEEGYKIVIAIKDKSNENFFLSILRKTYYAIIAKISETEQIGNFVGIGLYDKSFMQILHKLNITNPYFRGLVAEFGTERAEIPYIQRNRSKGKTKNNLYTLYEYAMLGFVSHSKVPLRLASFIGFIFSTLSLIISAIYFIYKLIYWNNFQVGMAPLVIGLFFFFSVQLFFIGILGEYIGQILIQVRNHPLVIEKERINFD